MRSSANAGGRPDFYPVMDKIDLTHCRLDLDRVTDGLMSPATFIEKWRDALRAYLVKNA